MAFDYRQRFVWLEDLTEPVVPGAGYAFCVQHADRLTPPLGWTLTDRREAVEPLFSPLEVA
jgi:hypothetical protein